MENIAEIMRELPRGYEEACFEEKAIQRKRGISCPGNLMLLSMFHIMNGCSLIEISSIARLAKLGKISDVGFMKRFENCNSWFQWINAQLVSEGAVRYERPAWLQGYRVLPVDASDVTEKGRSGRTYRLHYALDLFCMQSAQYKITDQKVGETLCNFQLKEGDLVLADRIYSTFNGIRHCLESKADFVMRLRKNSFTLYNAQAEKVDLLASLRVLGQDETLNLWTYAKVNGSKGESVPLRICARRKTPEAIVRCQKRIIDKERRQKGNYTDETKEFNDYIVLVTALPDTSSSEQILELYRLRWQVEIYFKRLKSILDFGDLPKRRAESVMAWLNGKIMVALLIEKMIGRQSFSPDAERKKECLA